MNIPLIILAGSDHRRSNVPEGVAAENVLAGYKGAIELPDGRPLVAAVIENFRRAGRFRDPILVGPARVYAPLKLDCKVVDSDGTLTTTLEDAVRVAVQTFDPQAPVAFVACDILPSGGDLRELMDEACASFTASAFWTQLVAALPTEMGASGWKPSYTLQVPGRGVANLYPGHLVIVRPAALNFEIVIRLLHLAYRFRNRGLGRRVLGLPFPAFAALLACDLRNLLRGRPTALSVSVPSRFLYSYLRYRSGRFSIDDLEQLIASVFVRDEALDVNDGRPVVFSVTHLQSFAKDIDTQAELAEILQVTP